MMKKTLVLAMAMVLGVTASVYAANPFSDVPAGHWAYAGTMSLQRQSMTRKRQQSFWRKPDGRQVQTESGKRMASGPDLH